MSAKASPVATATKTKTFTAAERSTQIKSIRFGVEIETCGARRRDVAKAIVAVLGLPSSAMDVGDTCSIKMRDGRVWRCVPDGSLGFDEAVCEVVTPILTYVDVDMLVDVIRAVRGTGARVNYRCGVHVHTDAAAFDGKAVSGLARYVYVNEPILVEALGVKKRVDEPDTSRSYCQRVKRSFIERLPVKPRTREAALAAWYGSKQAMNRAYGKMHNTRYHGMNLHSVKHRGTVEWRYFAGTLHGGEIRSHVELCCALATKAIHSPVVVGDEPRAFNAATARADIDTLLDDLGLVGDEWETVRYHMTKRFPLPTDVAEPIVETVPVALVTVPRTYSRPRAPRRLSGDYFRDMAVEFIVSTGGAQHTEIIEHICRRHPEMVRSDGIVSGTVRQIMTDLPARRPAVQRGTRRGSYVPANRRTQGAA